MYTSEKREKKETEREIDQNIGNKENIFFSLTPYIVV
jgi:hypothetical protein